MKIYSKEHDYYDVAMKNHDENIKYSRKPEIVAIENKTTENIEKEIIDNNRKLRLPFDASKCLGSIHIITIFFCGKMYFCFEIGMFKPKYFYSLDKLKEYIDKRDIIDRQSNYIGYWKAYNIAEIMKNETSMNNYYSEEKIIEIHKKYNSPIVAVGIFDNETKYRVGIYKDFILNKIEFFKVFDVYTAFQEIEMFLGSGVLKGVGINEDGDVQIADEYMIKQKGFDDCSFRKCEDTRPRKQKKGKLHH